MQPSALPSFPCITLQMSSKNKSPSRLKRDQLRIYIYNLKKQAKVVKKPDLSISFGHAVSILPAPSFSSLATPPEIFIQKFIPKLRNMKIEIEFTLTEDCENRDIVDLSHEHIRVLSHIIRQIELLRPH